jgi:hypothetical protein
LACLDLDPGTEFESRSGSTDLVKLGFNPDRKLCHHTIFSKGLGIIEPGMALTGTSCTVPKPFIRMLPYLIPMRSLESSCKVKVPFTNKSISVVSVDAPGSRIWIPDPHS